MSFGGSQGTVRYAVLLQDQVSAPAQKISNEFRNMGTSMTTLTQKANVFNNSIMSNTRAFSASVTPIKNTGNALNQLGVQQKTVGSQLASIGSGFKNNALAIGAAASSVLGLYQNYANLSSAQNSANKAATAAKAAQNNLAKAQDNVSKAVAKYGSNSKEATTARNKLTVAEERASQKAESAKIAQDNLNQTMADFGINILPNIVLAGGSIASIFDNINLKGKSLTGLFKGLGAGITSAISGIASGGGGLTGLMDKLKGAGGAATGLKANLLGLGVTTAVIGGVTFAALELGKAMNILALQFSHIKEPVSALEVLTDKSGKSLKTWGTTVQETEAMARAGVSPLIFALDSVFGTHMTQNILKNAGALDAHGKIIVDWDKKAQTIPTSMNAAAASSNAMVNAIIVLRTQAEKGQITWNQYFDALAKLKIPGAQFTAIMDEVNMRMKANAPVVTTATKNLQGFGQSSGEVDDALKKLGPSIIATDKNTTDLNSALVAGFQEIQKGDPIVQGFGDTAANMAKKLKLPTTATNNLTSATLNFRQAFNDTFVNNPAATTKTFDLPGLKEQIKAVEDAEDAIVKLGKTYGLTNEDFKEFIKNGKDDTVMMNELVANAVDYTSALTDMDENQKLVAEGFRDGMIQAKGFFDNLVKGTTQEQDFNAAVATGATALGIHSNLLAFSSGKMQELIKTTYEQSKGFRTLSLESAKSTAFLKDHVLIQAQVNDGMLEGTKAANDWAISNVKATAQSKAFHDQLLKITEDMTGLAIPAGTTNEALQKMQTTFLETKDAGRALAQMMTDKLAPSFERVSGLIQSKDMKELRDNLKKMELPPGFKHGLDDAFKPLRGAAEEARQLGNAMDILVTGDWSHNQKDLTKNMKAFGKELDRISKIKGTSAPVDAILNSLKTMSPTELGQHTQSMQFLVDTINKFGSLPKDKAKEFIDMYNSEVPGMGPASDTAARGVNTLADSLLRVAESSFDPTKFIPKEVTSKGMHVFKDPSLAASAGTQKTIITADNTQAIKKVDQVAKRILDLAGIVPKINVDNAPAVKKIDQIVKRIQDLAGIVPKINVNNTPAIKKVDQIAKRIEDLAKLEPKININNTQAIKKVDQIAKRIMDLPDGEVTVKIKTTGSVPGGAKFDSSKADSGGVIFSKANSGSGGGGGGNLVINNVIDIGTEKIVRTVKRKLGQGFYAFGA